MLMKNWIVETLLFRRKFFTKNDDDELKLKTKTQKLENRAFPEAIVKIFRYF